MRCGAVWAELWAVKQGLGLLTLSAASLSPMVEDWAEEEESERGRGEEEIVGGRGL